MDTILHDLTIKSIESHARNTTRLDSIDLAMSGMRADHKELMGKVESVIMATSRIEENQRHNAHEHQILHKRVDDVKEDLDILISDHSPCKSLAKGIARNSDEHRLLAERVDDVERNCEQCPISGYKELTDKVDTISTDLKDLCKELKVVTFTIKGLPLWLILVALVIFNTVFVVANNWEWLMKAWSVVK